MSESGETMQTRAKEHFKDEGKTNQAQPEIVSVNFYSLQ